jgi:transposase
VILFTSKIRFPVAVSSEDHAQLEQWESAHGTPQQVALRCRILLGAIDGQKNQAIANRLNVSRPTVNLWRKRARDLGIGRGRSWRKSNPDAPSPEEKRRQINHKVICETLH